MILQYLQSISAVSSSGSVARPGHSPFVAEYEFDTLGGLDAVTPEYPLRLASRCDFAVSKEPKVQAPLLLTLDT